MVLVPKTEQVTSYDFVVRVKTDLIKTIAAASFHQILVKLLKMGGIKEIMWSIYQMAPI